jgi:LuxR family maltose regulon positive regulatory protein
VFGAVAPWAHLVVRVTLARAGLLLGDPVAAATFVKEAERSLPCFGDAVRPKALVAELAEQLQRARHSIPHGPSALTTAETRVLQFLPTNMSLGAIAERLYVSRHTVKAQSIAIYRKLGVSSRAEAVDRARDAGLLAS